MSIAVWAGVAVAAVGVGLTAYGMATAPGSPEYRAPPAPPNSTVVGEDGQVLTRQVFDSATNTWVTYQGGVPPKDPGKAPANPGEKPVLANGETNAAYDSRVNAWKVKKTAYDKYLTNKQEYDTWKTKQDEKAAEKTKLAALKTEALGNLSELSPERLAEIEKFGTDFAASMRKETDEQFLKIGRGYDEKANATGMFGSRAYADTQAEMAKDKMTTETDIAQQATMAKEQLRSQDRSYWASLLDQINNNQNSSALTAAQINKSMSDSTANSYAGTLGYYSALNNNNLAKWGADQARSSSYTSAGTNMAGGLMYLYGMKSGGGGGGVGTGGSGGIGGVGGYKSNFGLSWSGGRG